MRDVRLYVPPSREGWPTLHMVTSFRGNAENGSTLFTSAVPNGFQYKGFTLIDTPEGADYVLAPHPISRTDQRSLSYVAEMKALAKEAGKQLILFIGSDLSHDIFIDGVIALKGSQYGYLRHPREYTVVPFAEDLSEVRPFIVRKKSDRPVVSFCGWAGFPSFVAYAKYIIRNMQVDLESHIPGRAYLLVRKKGLYWRRKAMRLLERDPRIDTRFIIRKTFSASAKTISVNPALARSEYIENMGDSDFVLAPKGDGNFSVRFYEALSQGRIPILIDTDMVLPFGDLIDYDRFVLRVSYKDINRLPAIVADFYVSLTEEGFADMQRASRAAYTDTLRYDKYFETLFTRVLLPSDGVMPAEQA